MQRRKSRGSPGDGWALAPPWTSAPQYICRNLFAKLLNTTDNMLVHTWYLSHAQHAEQVSENQKLMCVSNFFGLKFCFGMVFWCQIFSSKWCRCQKKYKYHVCVGIEWYLCQLQSAVMQSICHSSWHYHVCIQPQFQRKWQMAVNETCEALNPYYIAHIAPGRSPVE